MRSVLVLVSLCCLTACPSTDEECAFVAGQITTSAGSSVGDDRYSLGLGAGSIAFSNLNATFYPGGPNILIADTGPLCLDEVTAWPGGGTGGRITMFIGHTYVVEFSTVQPPTYARFVVDDYADGVITVTFVPSL
jgi:hypothetical protein